MNETTSEVETASPPPVAVVAGEGREGWRKDVLLPLGLSVLLTAVFFWDVAFTDRIFADRDTLIVYMPMFKYWAERILSGEWPDWFPYDGLGQPYAGAMYGMAFHPIKLLFLMADVGTAMKWATLLCFPLAFNGMFHLCRSLRLDWKAGLAGGILFSFNGYAVSETCNFSYLLGMASMPWAWWATVRFLRKPCFMRCALASFAYAMVLFSGETQSFLTTCAAGAVLPLVLEGCPLGRTKSFAGYCLVMLGAAAMSAIQWVPALQVMRDGIPGASGAGGGASTWSAHPLRLLELLVDGVTGHGHEAEALFSKSAYHYSFGGFWARSVYFGIPGAFLCAMAWWKDRMAFWILLVGSVFSLLLCMGSYVGLYEALKFVPLFRPLRYPEKCFALAMLILSLMAAYGFAALGEGKVPSERLRILGGVFLAASAVLLVGEAVCHLFSSLLVDAVIKGAEAPSVVREEIGNDVSLSLALSLSVLAAACLGTRTGRQALFLSVAWLGMFIQLFVASEGIYVPAIPELASTPVPPVNVLWHETADGFPPRYLPLSKQISVDGISRKGLSGESQQIGMVLPLFADYPALFGVEAFNTYLPATSRRMMELKNSLKDARSVLFAAGLYSASHFTVWAGDYAEMEGSVESVAYENRDFGTLLVRLGGFMPRAYLAAPVCVSGGIDEFADMVRRQSVDFTRSAAVECPPGMTADEPREIGDDVDLGSASIAFRKPEHVAVDVDAQVDGSILVLTDAYYSGWKATIDGAPAEILPANHAVRGVMVPKGRHRVEFTYRTPGLVPAAVVSLGTMLASLMACMIQYVRRRRMGQVACD